ncbi:MAG: hypothetical protein MHPSP_001897 [Paramarteilia canceri]
MLNKDDSQSENSFSLKTKDFELKQVCQNEYSVLDGDNCKKGTIFVNEKLRNQLVAELENSEAGKGNSSFLPAVKQLINVSNLPGNQGTVGLPDIHSGYGFSVGSVAAFDGVDSSNLVSPGGVGFDINCGIRVLVLEKSYEDIKDKMQCIMDEISRTIPAGVGSSQNNSINDEDIANVLQNGVQWCLDKGYCSEEDIVKIEDNGCLPGADIDKVSEMALKRGKSTLGSLGSESGQVCVMIHTGSRGLGHQVALDYVKKCLAELEEKNIKINDKQLAFTTANSQLGKDYLSAMNCAANFAYANRALVTNHIRKAFKKVLDDENLSLNLIYDVSHNIAKFENHIININVK